MKTRLEVEIKVFPVMRAEVLQKVEANGKGPGTLLQNKKDLGKRCGLRTLDPEQPSWA